MRSVVAAPVTMLIFFFSLPSCWTASATEEVVSSMMASTLSVSYHCRARFEATSGLFWWSAVMTSIGALSDLAAEILDRHLGGLIRPLAAEIGIDARLVVEDADLDGAVRDLGLGGERAEQERGDRRRR